MEKLSKKDSLIKWCNENPFSTLAFIALFSVWLMTFNVYFIMLFFIVLLIFLAEKERKNKIKEDAQDMLMKKQTETLIFLLKELSELENMVQDEYLEEDTGKWQELESRKNEITDKVKSLNIVMKVSNDEIERSKF